MTDECPQASPILAVRDLAVGIPGGRRILHGVSFDIGEGETLCLVGDSGSGKSVTALSIMGLLPAPHLTVTSGSICLAGEELVGATPGRLRTLRPARMAMIFQEPMTALNPVMRVDDQIAEVLRQHTRMRRAERRERILGLFDQLNLRDGERICASYPHQLSGGQRQRVMMAMAMVLGPRLLIADEPTSALDVTTQKRILGHIQALKERYGTSVLFITHDMGVVADIAERVAVMRDGQIVETGACRAILARPRHADTRRLLRAVPGLVPKLRTSDRSADVVLEARSLSKVYGNRARFGPGSTHAAIDQVDLALRRGQTLGLVGESGSGKSTLARCLLRLMVPTTGSVQLEGTDIGALSNRSLRPYRRLMQILFQDPNRSLNPRRTVGQSLIEGPRNYAVPRERALQDARELLSDVGLPEYAMSRYPHQFSGGERQRIALARALMTRPLVLVADEPVSALDMSSQAQILGLLSRIRDRMGLALLFITHDLRVASQLCDDLAVMQDGRIVEQGPTAQVLSDPRHPHTRQLRDAVPGRHWDFARSRPAAPSATADLAPRIARDARAGSYCRAASPPAGGIVNP